MSETLPVEKPLSQYELLDTDPAVSVNLSMKNKLPQGEAFHVDYDALRKTLEAVEAPADNSGLSIEFGSDDLGIAINGSYSPSDKAVSIAHKAEPLKVQKTLQHELRHYSDIVERPVTNSENIKNFIGSTANKSGIPLSGALTLANVGLFADKFVNLNVNNYEFVNGVVNTSEIARNIILPVQIGALALSGFYWFHNRERTARKAEKLKLPTVVSRQPILQ
jgi:hypothetical protein